MFDEFKRIQQQRRQEEEKKAAEAEAQAQQQLAQMNIYQPPQTFMQQYNDPAFFNYEYEKYRAHLASSNEEDAAMPTTVVRSQSEVSDDRNQEDLQNLPQESSTVPVVGAAGAGA